MQSVTQPVKDDIFVDEYTGGLVGPGVGFAGTVKDGGRISCVVPPGCWGPMITPEFRGGHEVTRPVAVEGAHIGDAIAITIERMHVRSLATSSGTMLTDSAAFGDDPFVDKKCPHCGTHWPKSRVEGTGPESIRCQNCGAPASAFMFEEGYTIVFDDERTIGLTVGATTAHDFATRAREVAALPEHARQHPILLFEPHTIPGVLARLRPFIGNIGTTPSVDMPDSHNAGDFGHSLVGAHHPYALTQETLDRAKTDGHLDTNEVRPGAVLICPVKVEGGGVYIGDCHANQGDGELSLHTTDITADATVRVNVIHGLTLDGPILLPVAEDLPSIARPYTQQELEAGQRLAERYQVTLWRSVAPVQFIGSGPTLNEATDNAIARAASLLQMSQAEVRNRCTITGSVEIGRLPGVVQLTLLAPLDQLDTLGIGDLARQREGLEGEGGGGRRQNTPLPSTINEGRPRMRISVRLFGPLRVVVGSDEIALALSGESATVAQALEDVVARYPQTRRYLGDVAGSLPPGMRALLAESRLDDATALAAPLRDGDRLTLLMPIVGG